MKNIKKLLALVLVVFIGLTTNAKATSKWDVKRENLEKTTVDIKPNINKEENLVTYIIPENYNGKKIYINVSEDVAKITAGTYVPGDRVPFTIRIVNNSSYSYEYIKNSFKVLTDDMSVLAEKDNFYSYDINEGASGVYVKDSLSFDRQLIAAKWSINRTQNDAIKKLYENSANQKREKINNSWKYVYYYNNKKLCDYYTSWRANLCNEMFTDEVLGAELIAQGYKNGIKDLNKYYLDYYNKLFKTDAKKIEDLPDDATYGYPKGLDEYLGGIFNGNAVNIRETNAEVSSFGYNWFYNKGVGIYPIKDVNGTDIKSGNTSDNGFYIGNYMRNESTIAEEVLVKDLGIIKSKSENSLTPMKMFVDFTYVTNTFGNMDFGFNIKLELAKEIINGKLIVNYIDEDGNNLTDSIITEEEVDTLYSTEKKEFEGFEFLKVEGETEGKYIDGVIEVTYIYKNAVGDVDEPQIPIEPEEPIEPPHTDATITANDSLIYFEDKRKFIK